jgi:TolB protein
MGLRGKRTMKKLSLWIALMLTSATAYANLKVEVTQGTVNPISMALLSFEGNDKDTQAIAKDISGVIQNDLQGTGLFDFVPPESFIQTILSLDMTPRYQDWKILKSEALINGQVKKESDGTISVSFRLWDIYAESMMASSAMKTNKKYWRRIAHLIADMIYKRITGEEGYFDTRIVYVSETGSQTKRKKRLAIMDHDGANHKYLTDGKTMVMSPRFSPKCQTITYMTYDHKVPKVFILDLETGKQQLVGRFPGLTYAPRFSPDGHKVIMSQSLSGSGSLYVMDLRNRMVTQLTKGPYIDTSPCYSPDGEKVVFNSDRSGKKQLYVMNADGSNMKRVSFGGGLYATPVWSPRGDLIAFTKQEGGQFYIGLMKPDGTEERNIATGFMVEAPTWSPNGRLLMFWSQGRSGKDGKMEPAVLKSIDITGRYERIRPTPQDATDPAWSPPLPLTLG